MSDEDDPLAGVTDKNVRFDAEHAPAPENVVAPQDTPAAQILEEQRKQEHQNTFWRRILFWLAVVLVAACVLASLVVGICYFVTAHGHADATVLSAWFGANVIQVVGVLIVITRHLFPERDGDKQAKKATP